MHDRLSDNPEPRYPYCLIVDSGGIKVVNDALAQFKADISADPLASLRIEISLVSFNHTVDYVDFCSAQQFEPPELTAGGGTKISRAINTALDLLSRRKQEYRANGISYYRPIVVLLTDGQAEHDSPEELAEVQERLIAEEDGRRIAFFAFGIEDAGLEALSRITPPHRPPQRLGDSANIAGLFSSVGNSCGCVLRRSIPNPGERLRLEPFDAFLDY